MRPFLEPWWALQWECFWRLYAHGHDAATIGVVIPMRVPIQFPDPASKCDPFME